MARDLPWRRTHDPYAIWVSEVMLQQTRTEVVARYYARFMEDFPNVAALARAEDEAVRARWSGLGYYRRAALLHKGARVVVDQHGGVVPSDLETLLALPGVGRYTAGAIRSFAFDQRAPIVDGNVGRVFSRIGALEGPVDDTRVRARHWALADAYVDADHPNTSNQALIELGATVCTPKAPTCGGCPVRPWCKATATGHPERFPAAKTKARSPEVARAALVLRDPHGRVLLRRRPRAGLLASLWEAPAWEGAEASAALARWAERECLADLRDHGVVQHVFTHRKWRTQVRSASIGSDRWDLDRITRSLDQDTRDPEQAGSGSAEEEMLWAAEADLQALGLPTASRNVLLAAGPWSLRAAGGRSLPLFSAEGAGESSATR